LIHRAKGAKGGGSKGLMWWRWQKKNVRTIGMHINFKKYL
jgi:hypothetical protein